MPSASVVGAWSCNTFAACCSETAPGREKNDAFGTFAGEASPPSAFLISMAARGTDRMLRGREGLGGCQHVSGDTVSF